MLTPAFTKPRSLSVSSLQPLSLRHRLRERRPPAAPALVPAPAPAPVPAPAPETDEPCKLSDEDTLHEVEQHHPASLSPRLATSRSPSPSGSLTVATVAPSIPPPAQLPPPPLPKMAFSPRKLSVLQEEPVAPVVCDRCRQRGATQRPSAPRCALCHTDQRRQCALCDDRCRRRPSEPYLRVCNHSVGPRRHSANLECTIRQEAGVPRRSAGACHCRAAAPDCRIPLSPTRCCDVAATEFGFIKELAQEEDETDTSTHEEVGRRVLTDVPGAHV